MSKKLLYLVVSINLLIASSFFISNIGAGYSKLSSDLHNIIPMCIKFDQPNLYKGDLYLNELDNFKYYTPFFIQTLRFFSKLTNGDYFLSLNIVSFFTHMIYGLSWFFLCYILFKRKFWLALIFSILLRGIIWLPGYEIWGISDLWSIMPRTIYAALFPIPFIFLFLRKKYHLLISSFLIGFIFNFHPISGLGGMLLFVLLIIGLHFFSIKKYTFKESVFALLLMILGALPFVITYFGKTESLVQYDLELYQKAFNSRIPQYFSDPVVFIKKWVSFKSLFFCIPLVSYVCYALFWKKDERKKASILLLLTISLVLIPSISVYIENSINDLFSTNIRMAFQIIRVQKLAIIPGFFALGFLSLSLINNYPRVNKFLPIITISYLIIVVFSNQKLFNYIPFVSDDITRNIYPSISEVFKPNNEKLNDFDKMALYINDNTSNDDVFYGSYMIRSASQRSVVYDRKGASILIEGNPKALISWYLDMKILNKLKGAKKIEFLKEKGVNYILSSTNNFSSTLLAHKIGNQYLYKIQ